MAIFDVDKTNYPKRWADMSFEYKAMFVYHGCMMVMMFLGSVLSMPIETMVVVILLMIITFLSIKRRQKMKWHWAGINLKVLFNALFVVAMIGVFFFATLPTSLDSGGLPWCFAIVGLTIFSVLHALKIVYFSEADFQKNCGENKILIESSETIDSLWKRIIRAIFTITFLLLWLEGMASFYFISIAMHDGSPTITSTQTERLVEHGQTYFVTSEQKQRIDYLEKIFSESVPIAMICGAIIHFLLGVRLFPNAPTFWEWLKRRRMKT